MQRKWLLLAAGAMLSTVIAGCSENHGELGNRNIRQYSLQEDGNGNMILKNRFANDQMNDRNRMNGRRLNSNNIIGSHRNYQLDMNVNLSEQVSALSGVGQAYVMLTDHNAYVAVQPGDAGGISAKSVPRAVRPLSRTDMAYISPRQAASVNRSSMRNTMSRNNYERMMESKYVDEKGRFDSTKSYDSVKSGRLTGKSLPGTDDTFTRGQNVSRFNNTMNQLRNRTNFTNPSGLNMKSGGTDSTLITPYGSGENRWRTNGYRESREYDMYGSGYSAVRPYSALQANPGAAVLPNGLDSRIAAELKRLDPTIKHVYVSSNPDFVHRMTAYMEDVRLGHPIQAYIAEFNAMVERVFPPKPVRK